MKIMFEDRKHWPKLRVVQIELTQSQIEVRKHNFRPNADFPYSLAVEASDEEDATGEPIWKPVSLKVKSVHE